MWRYFLFSFLMLLFTRKAACQGYEAPKTQMTQMILKDFIRKHMEYPSKAMSEKKEGVVEITFNTDKEGNVTDARVTKSVSPDIDSSAISLFRLILWKPARQYGLPVDNESSFKIKYNIKKYKSWVRKRKYDSIPLPYRPVSSSLKIYSLKELDQVPTPILQGNYSSLQKFIVSQLEMPEAAVKLHLTGTVKLQFVIEVNGLPSNITILEPLGGGCSEEAVRIAQMIRWTPGIKKDKAVRSCYDLSFTFSPPGELRDKNIPNQANSGL
jgi:TonB family protein